MEAKLLAPGLPFPAGQRRALGLLLGGGIGLLYGLVSASINRIALPGIPLYPPPPGPVLQVIGSAAGGAVLGLLAAWPREGLIGILFSAATGAAAISLNSLASVVESVGFTAPILLTFYTFLPRLFFYLPHAAIVRWGVSQWREVGPPPPFNLRRHAPVALLALGLAGLAGGCSLKGEEARAALVAMNEILQQAEGAARPGDLPEPLQGIETFLADASGAYSLEWSDNFSGFGAPRPMADEGHVESLIIVRYESGFRFHCAFAPPLYRPICEIPMLQRPDAPGADM